MPSNDPNQNPFQSMPQPSKPVATEYQQHLERPTPRTARLGFFDCFFEAKEFFGTDYWLFWALVFVGGLIGSVVPLLLIGPIYCGIGLCFLAKEKGQQPSFELMFKGFEQFMESLIPVLLYSIALIVIIPCYMGGLFGGLALISSGEEVGFILGGCLIIFGVTSLILGSTFMSYGYLFSTFLVADYKLEGMDAFNISLSGIQKNFFGLLGITIASAIIGIVGMMLCYIPFLLMLPLFMGGPFICYRKIFRDYAKSAQKPVKIDIAE